MMVKIFKTKKDNNSQEDKAKLAFTLGSIMGDMLKSVKSEEKYNVLAKYKLNLEEATNEDISNMIKNILHNHTKYCNKSIKDIFKELELNESLIPLIK